MGWGKLDDQLHRNEKQLSMSDSAFRVWMCSVSLANDLGVDVLPKRQAEALVRSLGKTPKVITELLRLSAWEERQGGWYVHDIEQYRFQTSTARVQKHRAKAVSETFHEPSAERKRNATETAHARGNPGTRTQSPDTDSSLRSESPPKPPVNGGLDRGYREFVEELNRATGRQFQGDAEGRKLYERRLRDRTHAQCLAAARGVAYSKHHMGLNDSMMPYNSPANVLRSKVFDQLVDLGNGDLGLMRPETDDERYHREVREELERQRARREAQA